MNELPLQLLKAIKKGTCVAFVGAGFSYAAMGSWEKLLKDIAIESKNEALVSQVKDRLNIKTNRSFHLEAIGQLLRDMLKSDFEKHLQTVMKHAKATKGGDLKPRLDWLLGIPFRAILTLNFDPFLEQVLDRKRAYANVLGHPPTRRDWWKYWDRKGAPVIKLHGDIICPEENPIVFSTQDYRSLLYANPSYLPFLRTVLATQTVLYMGFSFTDAYVNELRSEVLSLFGETTTGTPEKKQPRGYAIMNDVDEDGRRFFREHQGIEVLTFDSQGLKNFKPFDDYLAAIHRETQPGGVLGRILAGKTLLWVDARKAQNDFGIRQLQAIANTHGNEFHIEQVAAASEALKRIGREPKVDLVITAWGHGHGPDGQAVGEYLLTNLKPATRRPPVIVFTSQLSVKMSRRTGLALGAYEMVDEWPDLFESIERVFVGANLVD